MKRTVLALCLCAAIATATWAAFVSHDSPKPFGDNTVTFGTYYIVTDSTDTFEVDTQFSDWVPIDDETKWIQTYVALSGFTLCDSCNDSVTVILTGHGDFDGGLPGVLSTDTFTTTLDSTEAITNYISLDSTVINRFRFRTIVQDSVIQGTAIDSIRIKMQTDVGQVAR